MTFTHSRNGKPANKSGGVWGLAFYHREPWAERRNFFYYDCAPFERDGKTIVRFDMENGWAEYEVLENDGIHLDCKLIASEWRPMTPEEIRDAGE